MIDPDPCPQKRWTKRLLDSCEWGLGVPSSKFDVIDICVSKASLRPRSRFISSTLYDKSVPDDSFIHLNSQIAIPCPELLFAELAPSMGLASHLMLGLELCGGFSRNADDPINGDVVMNITAATSTAKIGRFLDSAHLLSGTKAARRTLRLFEGEAWSPLEAVVATTMMLPLEGYGYGLGKCKLNPRYRTPERLAGTTNKDSRVPDIMIGGTSVGINYDGGGHLNLDSIAKAAMGLGQDPGSSQRERELDEALRKVRMKALDDIRRNRELTADGLTVFQVYKEDLYEYGGLDKVMMQVLTALELREGWNVDDQMAILRSSFARRERQALVYSMMPGSKQVPPSNVEDAFVRI